MRKAAGEDLIVATGDDIRLNPACVTCDVWEFEALLSDGEGERAVRRYTGPLLDGFFLSDAPEFERWTDGERDRLARLYSQALEELAAEAQATSDFVAAAQWWRRLAAHDPFSSRVALGLMNALGAAGDAAAAIRHAGIHATLLREELEAEPNQEINALAERLRAGVPSAERTLTATPIPWLRRILPAPVRIPLRRKSPFQHRLRPRRTLTTGAGPYPVAFSSRKECGRGRRGRSGRVSSCSL